MIKGFSIKGGQALVNHRVYMEEAIELAKKGRGFASPNPLVGAIVVKDGVILGKGYHERAGLPHAEVIALEEAKERAQGATLYVNLEPCSHYGRTPPCVSLIQERGIERVVAAMEDPNPLVKGRGFFALREAGIEVEVGIMEEEARRLNHIFIHYITKKRPYVYLKGAMTLDGKIATRTGDSKWISNSLSRELAHQLRHRLDAILVGRGTVEKDDPKLTTRLPNGGGSDGARIILDSHLRLSSSRQVFHLSSKSSTLLATISRDKERALRWKRRGVEVLFLKEREGRVDLEDLLQRLGEREITSILVEGGSEVNGSFFEAGLVDTLVLFISPKILSGREATPFTGGRGWDEVKNSLQVKEYRIDQLNEDLLVWAQIGGMKGVYWDS